MKIRRNGTRPVSSKAQMTFRDVAACFSKEEWKLLDEWQKELYKNVMMEIQQVLISLGPLIAASVFSLSAKENEDLRTMNNEEPQRRHLVDDSNSGALINADVLYRLNREEILQLDDPQGSEAKDSNTCLGFQFLNPDICLRKEGEDNASFSHHLGAEGESSIGRSTGNEIISSVVSFHIKEEGMDYSIEHQDNERLQNYHSPTNIKHSSGFPFQHAEFSARNEDQPTVSLMSHPSAEAGESSTDPISEHAVIPEVVVVLKEENEPYSMDPEDREIIERIVSPTGTGKIKKLRKVGASSYTERFPHYQSMVGKVNAKVQKSKKTRIPVWSESNWKLGGEKVDQYESGGSSSPYLNVHQVDPKPGRSDTYEEREGKLRNLQYLKSHSSTQQFQRMFTCTECDKSYCLKGELIRHMITHSGVRPYPCTECGKSFFQMPHLIRHHRTHSGEKPYSCSFCHKRFNRKDNLNGHERIHTGERPYKCNECDKRFIRKSDLNEHRRKHF
ncbi:zinc finger protein 248-like isoform X2 [Ambystoma mexicanum]|uniref:zinc finger protein 248-like isoform X2 n=1 Tax=Ambystoma mexicanum TaxID=8296 RepID=UPI0037E88508